MTRLSWTPCPDDGTVDGADSLAAASPLLPPLPTLAAAAVSLVLSARIFSSSAVFLGALVCFSTSLFSRCKLPSGSCHNRGQHLRDIAEQIPPF